MKKVILLLFLSLASCMKQELHVGDELYSEVSIESGDNSKNTIVSTTSTGNTSTNTTTSSTPTNSITTVTTITPIRITPITVTVPPINITSIIEITSHDNCQQTNLVAFSNWHPGEPNSSSERRVFIDINGKWYDHHSSLNDSGFGIYEIKGVIGNIGESYLYLGEYKGHSYFRTKNPMTIGGHIEIIRDNNQKRIGSLVVFNDLEENNAIRDMLNVSPPAPIPVGHGFWIGAENPGGNQIQWLIY